MKKILLSSFVALFGLVIVASVLTVPVPTVVNAHGHHVILAKAGGETGV